MLQRWRRMSDLLRAAHLKRVRLDPVLRWAPEQLAAHQERRWRAVARMAAERAPYYRELYRGIDLERAPLRDLPPVDKAQLMDRFDEAVTDPALRLADLEAFLHTASADATFRGRFRVLLTSGSTGRRGVIVYGPEEWIATLAASLRGNQILMGDRPFQSLATLTSTHPSYISGRLLRATDLGFPRRLTVDPEEPLEDVLPRLERFRPEVLFGYPSVIAPIARAQTDGRARLRPGRVIGAGEAVTPAFHNHSCPKNGSENRLFGALETLSFLSAAHMSVKHSFRPAARRQPRSFALGAFRLGAATVPCRRAGQGREASRMAARKSSSTVVGVDGPVRDEAVAAAERAGMPVGRWLERAVRKGLEEGLEPASPAGVELGELEALVRRVVADELEPLRASIDRQRAENVLAAASPVELVRERLRRRRVR